jgi:hypothetical protein
MDVAKAQTPSLPIYAALTGLRAPPESIEVCRGVVLRPIYVDIFDGPMMAFAPPKEPNSHHPAPWVAVSGGFSFENRVELAISDTAVFGGLQPATIAWLVAAVLRLQASQPLRVAVIGNIPFDQMGAAGPRAVNVVAFESSPHQLFVTQRKETENTIAEDLDWLKKFLPVAARLYHEERFFRAFGTYEHAQWSPTREMGVVLVWSAVETLFDIGARRDKTKSICGALADYVAADPQDRDRVYQVIQSLYYERGRVVHVGHAMKPESAAQSFLLAKAAFRRVLIDEVLPPSAT